MTCGGCGLVYEAANMSSDAKKPINTPAEHVLLMRTDSEQLTFRQFQDPDLQIGKKSISSIFLSLRFCVA